MLLIREMCENLQNLLKLSQEWYTAIEFNLSSQSALSFLFNQSQSGVLITQGTNPKVMYQNSCVCLFALSFFFVVVAWTVTYCECAKSFNFSIAILQCILPLYHKKKQHA